MPGLRGRAAALSAAAEPPVSSARVEPEPQFCARPLARFLDHSLPFLPPFLPAAAAAGKRRRGVAYTLEECGSAEGQNGLPVSPV